MHRQTHSVQTHVVQGCTVCILKPQHMEKCPADTRVQKVLTECNSFVCYFVFYGNINAKCLHLPLYNPIPMPSHIMPLREKNLARVSVAFLTSCLCPRPIALLQAFRNSFLTAQKAAHGDHVTAPLYRAAPHRPGG